MEKAGIKLLTIIVCIGFLTGCNLFGPSKKDEENAYGLFRALSDRLPG